MENIHLSKRPTHTRRDTDLLQNEDDDKNGASPASLLDQTVELAHRPSTSGGGAQDEASSDTASTIVKRKEFVDALLSSGTSSAISLPKYDLTRKELWAYYLYYVGNSGLPGFNFAPSAYQNLLTLQAANLGNGICGDAGQPECRLLWGGQMRSPTSIVLLTNGISFAIQAFIFIVLGTLADYGTFRPFILIVFSLLGIGIAIAWLGVTDPSAWDPTGTALYIFGLVCYQICLSFWAAAFPQLARCSPEIRQAADELQRGEMTPEDFSHKEMMMRNRISNIAFTVSSAGEVVILAIIQGVLVGIHDDESTESNTRALSAATAFSGGMWFLTALPWFFIEKHRPGQPLPPGSNYLTAGFKQAWVTMKVVWELKQSLTYLIVYFILGDALNTSVTVISTVQNQLVSFSTTKLNELLIIGIAAQGVGIYGFWLVQKRFKLSTLFMFSSIIPFFLMLQLWGFIGIFTDSFGFHNEWEAYAYQAFYGVFICPWYAISFTMISEMTPKGYEFLFFSLFSLVGKTSAFVGPFVTSAIANQAGNASMPFAFLLAVALVGSIGLFFIDVKKAKLEQQVFLQRGNSIKGIDAFVTPVATAPATSAPTDSA